MCHLYSDLAFPTLSELLNKEKVLFKNEFILMLEQEMLLVM
jgi:hypothetical protein